MITNFMIKTYKNDIYLLLGILIGDGCLSRSGNGYFISVVGHIKDDKPFFQKVVIPLLSEVVGKQVKARERENQRKIEICFSNKTLFEEIKKTGFPVGKKGIKLVIPKHIKKSLYRSVIRGYFATDGCFVLTNNNGIIYPRIEFSGISKKLLKQVLDYLNGEGMKGRCI